MTRTWTQTVNGTGLDVCRTRRLTCLFMVVPDGDDARRTRVRRGRPARRCNRGDMQTVVADLSYHELRRAFLVAPFGSVARNICCALTGNLLPPFHAFATCNRFYSFALRERNHLPVLPYVAVRRACMLQQNWAFPTARYQRHSATFWPSIPSACQALVELDGLTFCAVVLPPHYRYTATPFVRVLHHCLT